MSGHFATVLAGTLSEQFGLSKRRRETLCSLICGCVASRTVNLSHVASHIDGPAQIPSRYRRLQRFFQHARLDDGAVAHAIVALSGLRPPFTLCLDRTQWQLGKTDINVLVLAIAGRKARVPLLWTMIDGRGPSDTDTRIALIRRFCDLFGKDQIALLVADREFIGAQWFDFLVETDIPFVIRVKQNLSVVLADGRHTDVETLFSHRLWRNRETMSGLRFEGMKPPSAQRFALAAKTIKTGERLVLATNRDPRRAAGLYRRRWQIECLFAETKTRGLNIEDTRLRQPNKLCLLLAIVAIAIACAQRVARKVQGRTGIKRATHGYRRKSTFRTGFDHLRQWINDRSPLLLLFRINLQTPPKSERVV